jgi:hypothetical protein
MPGVRAFWAFVAFNVYSLVLITAFLKNSAELFDAKLVSQLRSVGETVDLGWGDHYIWRLFSSVVATALAGFLAGALVRENGGKVAAVANIPSVLVWAVTGYVMAFSRTEWAGQTGFTVISLVAIPLTTWIAYEAGKIGAEVQTSEFDESTVLGIRPSHWVWIAFVVYPYALGVVFVIVKCFALQFSTWGVTSIVGSVIALLALVPVIAWLMPLKLAYDVLSGETLTNKMPFVKALANIGILVGGWFVALGIQIACWWVVQKLIS